MHGGGGDLLSNRDENGDAGFVSFGGSVDCCGNDCLRVGVSEEQKRYTGT